LVRPKLVAGYDALVCSSHRTSQSALSLEVPDGSGVVQEFSVAGFYDGFTIRPLSPQEAMSAWRAASLAAAAQGRPAPPPPQVVEDTSPAYQKLMATLTGRLGADGWEVADWDKDGPMFTVKVYTDWGWAGFLEGTAAQIARELAAQREVTRAAEAAGNFNCPTCHTQLHPVLGPTQCGCGTVAWSPASWSDNMSKIVGLMPYLEDAPDGDTLTDLVWVDALCCTSEGSEYGVNEDDLLETYARLVPGARWSAVHGHLIAIVPTGTRFVPGAAGTLLDFAASCGYELAVDRSWSYGAEVTNGWFQRKANGAVDGLPERFTIGLHDDGTASVVAGVADYWWPANPAGDFDYDETLSDLVEEVKDQLMLGQQESAWLFDMSRDWGADQTGCAVFCEVPLTVVSVATLRSTLTEAERQLRCAFQQAEDLFTKVSTLWRAP